MIVVKQIHLKRFSEAGFTLVELLVVVAIIAVLMAALLPSLAKARSHSRRAVCGSHLQQVASAFSMYAMDYSDAYPAADDSAQPWLWMGRGWRPVLMPYICYGIDKANPSILWCAADPATADKYENTSYAYSMAMYHSVQQINAMNDFSFGYRNPVPAVVVRTASVAYPSAKILVGEWSSNHLAAEVENGWRAMAGARNFAFADGHVEFVYAIDMTLANDQLPDPNLTVDGHCGRDK